MNKTLRTVISATLLLNFLQLSATALPVIGNGNIGHLAPNKPATSGAPVITYPGAQTFAVGTAISPVTPTNTGGEVPNAVYGQQLFLAGSTSGYANGTGAAASFYTPRGFVSDAAGNLYVCEASNHTIRKITPAGVVTTLAGSTTAGYADGTGASAKFNSPSDMAIDAAGNLFVADAGNNRIRKVTPAGVVTTVAGNGTYALKDGTGAAASFYGPEFLTIDGSGNLYAIEYYTFPYIRKITPAGVVTTLTYQFGILNSIATNKAGDLYAIAYNDRNDSNGTVVRLLQNGVVNVVARVYQPQSLKIDTVGNIFVSAVDVSGINKIIKIAPSGETSTLLSNPANGFTMGINKSGSLFLADQNNIIYKIATTGYSVSPALPPGLAINGKGIISGTPLAPIATTDFKVTAYNNSGSSVDTVRITVNPAIKAPAITYPSPNQYLVGTAIASLKPANTGGAVPAGVYGQVSSFAGSTTPGSSDGNGANAHFQYPFDLNIDLAGNIYLADQENNRIRKMTPDGTVTTLAGSGAYGATDATGTAASFYHPSAVAIDQAGNVFVADQGSNLIRKITPAGVVTTFAGTHNQSGNLNGIGTRTTFSLPTGIAIDSKGNLYVSQPSYGNIRKITPDGVVTNFAGKPGITGSANGADTLASFGRPMGLATDLSGNIYVADQGNNTIRKITPAGVVSTLAGNGNTGYADGQGSAAMFNNPYTVSVDATGNVYVADYNNDRIRVVSPTGLVSTVAGGVNEGADNGVGAAAKFNHPSGVVVDGKGNLYEADFYNHSVRKVDVTGYTISPATLPSGLTFNSATGIITGTPTTSSPATNYLITGHNASGSSSATVNIKAAFGLNSLAVSSGALSPAFSPSVTYYSVSVDNSVSSITITPTADDSAAIKVNGKAVSNGKTSGPIALSTGNNNISVTVTAPDGVTLSVYTIAVNRQEISTGGPKLVSLALSNVTLSPAFSKTKGNYSASVGFNIASTKATFTAEANTVVTINGVNSTGTANIPLSVGNNIITTKVTNADGGTNTYTVIVTRGAERTQTIAFKITTFFYGQADSSPATASTGLPVTYTSANPSFATIVDGRVHIIKPGSAYITASQAGNDTTAAAKNVTQLITINKGDQYITFPFTTKSYGDAPFAPVASASSGLPLIFSSTDTTVAVVKSGLVYIKRTGTIKLMASQAGNAYYSPTSITSGLTVNAGAQTITFNKTTFTYGDADFSPATASSGLRVDYISANPTTASVVGDKVHIVKAGQAYISAVQQGDDHYGQAAKVTQLITINKANQTIAFAPITKFYGDTAFVPAATATSGLPLTYISNDTTVAVIRSGKIVIKRVGTTIITANQAGNGNYNPVGLRATLTVKKANQTIAFSTISANVGDADFSPAMASSGLLVTYTSANPTIASIVNNKVHILKAGGAYISATQAGNGSYNAATKVTQLITVVKGEQTITFNTITGKYYGDDDFAPGAVSSAGLTVNYTSTDEDIATIVNGKIHVLAAGKVTIIASQPGNTAYQAADSVAKTLTISKAAINVIPDNLTKVAGAANPPLTATYSGFVNGDTEESLTRLASFSTTAVKTSQAGKYPITERSMALSTNYTFVYLTGTLTVTAPAGVNSTGTFAANTSDAGADKATEPVVAQALSPNGDGINDVLTISGIAGYPDNKLSVMNSTGNLIAEVKNYDNSANVFDGHSKQGALQKPGTYFYVLEYQDGGLTKRKTGYIVLKY